MSAPDAPRIIAEKGGFVVAEQGPLVLVFDRRIGPLSTLAFVLGVIALVVGGFGAVVLADTATSDPAGKPPPGLGGAFLAVGIVFALAAIATFRGIRRRRSAALPGQRPVAVFDRAQRVFLDPAGTVVCPLNQVHFQRRMQLGSSSPKLVARTPHGEFVLGRGNPFAGGIGNLDQVLTTVVHG